MAYKFLLIFLFTSSLNYLYAQTGCCPYIGPIKIIPENPSTADSIKIVTRTTTPNLSWKIFYNFTQKADTFKLINCFYDSHATSTSTFYDTTEIGLLNEGTYFVHYTGKISLSAEFCSGYDSNSVS